MIDLKAEVVCKKAQIYGFDTIDVDLSYENGKQSTYNRVGLFDQNTSSVLIYQYTDKDGLASFQNIDHAKGPYYLVSHDLINGYNGVIADNIGGQDDNEER